MAEQKAPVAEAQKIETKSTKTDNATNDLLKSLTLNWDDSKMETTYANVVNASSTREEVSIFFGTNQSWNISEDKQLSIQLTDRIVLNPYAAKRLLVLLSRIVKEYEKTLQKLKNVIIEGMREKTNIVEETMHKTKNDPGLANPIGPDVIDTGS